VSDRSFVSEVGPRLRSLVIGSVCAGTVLASALAASAQPVSPEPPALARERSLFAAVDRKDGAALQTLLAADFVARGTPDVDRATWIKNALSLCWGSRFDIDAADVRTVGATEIVSFLLTFYQDPTTCQPATLRSLVTDVWIRDGEVWRLSVRHSGPAGGGVGAQFGRAPEVPPLFALTSELSFVATGGNSSTSTLGFSSEVAHNLGGAHTEGRVAFVRSSADDEVNARSLTVQGRHSRALSPRFDLIARGGFLRDLFSGIEHRVTIDAGIAATLSRAPRALRVDASVGGVFESRLDADDRRFVSGVFGLSFDWRLRPGTELHLRSEETTNLESPADWRFDNDLAVQVALNGALSARFAYGSRYVHQPVPGFRRTDTQATAALVVRLVRRPQAP
jgi:putative salt-induced outer membrane protein YdiY